MLSSEISIIFIWLVPRKYFSMLSRKLDGKVTRALISIMRTSDTVPAVFLFLSVPFMISPFLSL